MATSLPILPRPRIPRVFPLSSVPMNCNQTGKNAQVSTKSGARAPSQAGEARPDTHLLPLPFAPLHRSRCLGNLPARTNAGSEGPRRPLPAQEGGVTWFIQPPPLTIILRGTKLSLGLGAQVQKHREGERLCSRGRRLARPDWEPWDFFLSQLGVREEVPISSQPLGYQSE